MGVFESMILMRVTTVASVTEQYNQRNQLLQSLFDRYIVIHPTTHPHDPSAALHINVNFKNAISDVYEAPPQTRTSLDENSYYEPYSIDTSSFSPRYALIIPSPYSIATKNDKAQHQTRTDLLPPRQFPLSSDVDGSYALDRSNVATHIFRKFIRVHSRRSLHHLGDAQWHDRHIGSNGGGSQEEGKCLP